MARNEAHHPNTCPVCLDSSHDLKFLPCFHSFCSECIHNIADRHPRGDFPCPSCRRVTSLPAGGVASLQTNFYTQPQSSTPHKPSAIPARAVSKASPYMKNLLKNTHATEGLAHWKKSTATHPCVEPSPPPGADPIADYVPTQEIGGKAVQNWVTSYSKAFMTQRVQLLNEGFSKAVLDDLRPPIQVSVWCTGRWDCGALFLLKVRLLDKAGNEIVSMEKEKQFPNDDLRKAWEKVHHTFEGYAAGVRIVEFTMGGVDTKFWAGNYGAKFTLPSVRIVLYE